MIYQRETHVERLVSSVEKEMFLSYIEMMEQGGVNKVGLGKASSSQRSQGGPGGIDEAGLCPPGKPRTCPGLLSSFRV